ncbi:MAG: pyridoxal phosphate-dependent aminotransferase [Vicinamibacteria bacterium]
MVGKFGALASPLIPPPDADEIRISSNENPMGPGPSAISSIRENIGESNRYPMNSKVTDTAVANRIAKMFEAKRENVVLAPGSSEILRNAVRAFCGPDRALVTGECSYENPVATAEYFGVPVKTVANREDLGLDLDKMAGAALGAGLVFLCNPNNPTGTAHSKSAVSDFCRYVSKESPYTYVLVDEAYHDYVTDPSYDSAADLALKYRNVFVSRTFSKAFGMAGLRQGYTVGGRETAEKLAAYKLTFGTNVLGLAAVMASLDDPDYIAKEIARNSEVRKFTIDFFQDAGYSATNSQTNFIFVKTNMPAKDFREACEKFKVQVGRDFPPYEKTHARISIGTMDEMKRATEVFRQVLGMSATDSGAGPMKH